MSTNSNTPLSEILYGRQPVTMPKVSAEPKSVLRASQRIRRQWPDVESKPPSKNAETLAEEMLNQIEHQNRSGSIPTVVWRDYYWADVTRTAISFFGSGLETRTRYDKVATFLVEQIGRRRPFTRAMFRKYVETFSPDSRLTQELASGLRSHWHKTGLRIDGLVNDLGVFDCANAPRLLAYCMDASEAPFHALKDVGLEVPHGPGLPQYANHEFVDLQRRRIADGDFDAVARLLNWLDPGGDGDACLQEGAELAVNAILEPWLNHDPPPDVDKESIQKRLFSAYGDPSRRIGVWPRCSEKACGVMQKWVVGKRIRVFFDIVTETDRSHMWADRRQVWIDLHDQGYITEAWFAFSQAGVVAARQLATQRADRSLASFATNKSSSSEDRKKCLLLMKINGRWVVEGSHNFKTHVFPLESSTVQPYQPTYTCDQFRHARGPIDAIAHLANWRRKVLQAVME